MLVWHRRWKRIGLHHLTDELRGRGRARSEPQVRDERTGLVVPAHGEILPIVGSEWPGELQVIEKMAPPAGVESAGVRP
jgi:hypothetical protein